MKYAVHHANILDWAASYDGPPYHALLCDPPYGLEFMGAAWDSFSEPKGRARAPNTWGDFGSKEHPRSAADLARVQRNKSRAFYEFSVGWLEAVWPHLHSGAFCMAFSSTRTVHRLMAAAEDVGYVLHPIMAWSFGSGFPKATRIDVQVDRRAGAEPHVIGTRQHAPKFNAKAQGYREKDNGFNSRDRQTFDVTEPATELAAAWAGHRYGGQAIKPAFEPIVLFQKPYAGQPVNSITRTGAGALNIEAGRVASDVSTVRNNRADMGYHGGLTANQYVTGSSSGRWPANLLLTHNPDCNGTCTPGCAVAALGEQSGECPTGAPTAGTQPATTFDGGWSKRSLIGGGDSGTAARFFYNADYFLDRIDNPVRYVAKASTAEREAGLDGWEPTTVDDGRQTPIDNPYLRGETQRKNTHPTVKPINLAEYLATLLLPPALYAPRRILIPFSGSGSEMIGAGLAGWEECNGIELEAEHIEIARARLAWWIDVF